MVKHLASVSIVACIVFFGLSVRAQNPLSGQYFSAEELKTWHHLDTQDIQLVMSANIAQPIQFGDVVIKDKATVIVGTEEWFESPTFEESVKRFVFLGNEGFFLTHWPNKWEFLLVGEDGKQILGDNARIEKIVLDTSTKLVTQLTVVLEKDRKVVASRVFKRSLSATPLKYEPEER